MEPELGSQPILYAGERLIVGDYVRLDRVTGKLKKWSMGHDYFGCIRREVADGGAIYPADFGLNDWGMVQSNS